MEKIDKQYYWDLLEQVRRLENEQFSHNISVQTETMNLKGIAFCGLIRRGENFQIETNADEIDRLRAEQQKRIINNDNIKIPDLVETIKIRNMDNTIYSLELQFFKDMMKSDYEKYVNKVMDKEDDTDFEPFDLELPDVFSDIEELPEVMQPVAPKKKEPVKEQPKAKAEPENLRTESYRPELIGNIKYNRDPARIKNLDTFCVNQVRLVYQEGNQHAVVDFNIFPLTFSENELMTDIMVVALSGTVARAGISRGTSTAVKIEFDELSFMARGYWRDGEFLTQVNCLNKEFVNKFEQEETQYMPTQRTYTTYMQEDFGAMTYSFFPAIIGKNAASGNVPAAMVFEEGGMLQILLSNEKDAFSITDEDGLPCELSLYWSGGKVPQLKLQVDDD